MFSGGDYFFKTFPVYLKEVAILEQTSTAIKHTLEK
jgi:hypothetical protein